jgi:hypothetical protein
VDSPDTRRTDPRERSGSCPSIPAAIRAETVGLRNSTAFLGRALAPVLSTSVAASWGTAAAPRSRGRRGRGGTDGLEPVAHGRTGPNRPVGVGTGLADGGAGVDTLVSPGQW